MFSRPGRWIWTPSATPLQPKTWNAHFWITFNFWCSAGLVDGFEPHLPPLCIQKHEMLIFGLHSTSDDRPGWSMDSNPICHPSPVKKWNACFWITFNFWWLVGLVDRLEPHLPPLSSQKMKCSFLDYVQLLMIGRAGRWTWALCATSLQTKKWNAHFLITFNFWWLASWSMDSNPICHPSPAKKMKCSFLDYVQLLMIRRAGWSTRTPSATPLQPPHFWITFNFWWSAGLVNGLKPHPPSLSSQKMKCSFLDYIQLLMIGQAGRCTRTPFATSLQPQKWNAHFWITFNSWWLAGLVDGLKPHLQPK